MSKKEDEPVEEPQVEEDEGEESDEYEVEEEEEEEAGGFEEDDEKDDDEAGLTQKGKNLTALLLGGGAPGEEGDEEADEERGEGEDPEYTPVPEITGPATEGVVADPPPAIGRKRSRDDEDANGEDDDISGDYGEFEENSEAVKKKARAAEDEA